MILSKRRSFLINEAMNEELHCWNRTIYYYHLIFFRKIFVDLYLWDLRSLKYQEIKNIGPIKNKDQ